MSLAPAPLPHIAAPAATAAPAAAAAARPAARRTAGGRVAKTKEARDMQRKASHSAIERRRRERINDKIMQLKSLVPSCADKPTMHKLAVLEDGIAFILQMREYIAAVSGGVLPEQFVAVPCADAGAGSLDGDDGDDMADGADGDADMGAMDALAAAALRSAPAPMRALPALPPSPSPSASELLDGARSQPAHSPRPVIMALDSILS